MGARRKPLDIPVLTRWQVIWFWARVDKQGDGGCWLWRGGLQHTGYGAVSLFDRQYTAHRVALALSGVELDPELVCDHLCRNRACVNPEHVEQVTNRENLLRGFDPGGVHWRIGLCKRGHALTAGKRGRICVVCRREHKRLSRARNGRRYRPKPKRPCSVCREQLTASAQCLSCAMRAAWARSDYGERSRAERAGRRRCCLHCGEQGLNGDSRYHAACWRAVRLQEGFEAATGAAGSGGTRAAS